MSDPFQVPLVVGTVRKLQYGRGVSVWSLVGLRLQSAEG